MSDILTTRDGLIGNSPRYLDAISPPYQRYLKDDAGNAINLTGVPAGNLSIVFVNKSEPTDVFVGSGTFTIPSGTAAQGLISYQYGNTDLASGGNWYIFLTCQLIGELAPRVFDPDLLSIDGTSLTSSGGGTPVVTIQSINLTEVNGALVSGTNPVPIGSNDGAIVTIGTTTDTSSANTMVGLLKAIKAFLAGTLTVNQSNIQTDYDSGAGTQTMTMYGLALPASGGAVAGGTSTNPMRTDPTGTTSQPITLTTSATATVTSVSGAASDTSLIASNTSRRGILFYNDSTAILYLLFGTGAASTSNYTVQIPAQGFFEMPVAPVYTGGFHGIWAAANGSVKITELT